MRLTDYPSFKHRLEAYPEFLLRPDEVLLERGLDGVPVLIMQAHLRNIPNLPRVLNADELMRVILGSRTGSSGWWDGFKSNFRPRPCLHGLAAIDDPEPKKWCYEIHRDGYLIAMAWRFPESTNESHGEPAIAWFFQEFVQDFLVVASNVNKHLAPNAVCEADLAMTVTNPQKLRYLSTPMFSGGQAQLSPKTTTLDVLQVPVVTAKQGTETWNMLPALFFSAIAGAFGEAISTQPMFP